MPPPERWESSLKRFEIQRQLPPRCLAGLFFFIKKSDDVIKLKRVRVRGGVALVTNRTNDEWAVDPATRRQGGETQSQCYLNLTNCRLGGAFLNNIVYEPVLSGLK